MQGVPYFFFLQLAFSNLNLEHKCNNTTWLKCGEIILFNTLIVAAILS